MPKLAMIGRGSRFMMCAVVPDSWMPLRCMTNAIGALVQARADEAVQRLAGDPAGVAAVADDERVGACDAP